MIGCVIKVKNMNQSLCNILTLAKPLKSFLFVLWFDQVSLVLRILQILKAEKINYNEYNLNPLGHSYIVESF